MKRAVPLLLLAACSYDEARYQTDFSEANCQFTVQCYPDLYASVDDCIVAVGAGLPDVGGVGDSCLYDAAAAKDCVTGVEEMPCPTEGVIDMPAACANVYDCASEE